MNNTIPEWWYKYEHMQYLTKTACCNPWWYSMRNMPIADKQV
jgi:hypothetical protein